MRDALVGELPCLPTREGFRGWLAAGVHLATGLTLKFNMYCSPKSGPRCKPLGLRECGHSPLLDGHRFIDEHSPGGPADSASSHLISSHNESKTDFRRVVAGWGRRRQGGPDRSLQPYLGETDCCGITKVPHAAGRERARTVNTVFVSGPRVGRTCVVAFILVDI